MQPDDSALLLDMLLAARKVMGYLHGVTPQAYYSNEILQDACIHQVQVIGEAASQVSGGFRDTHEEIAWAEIIGMRHRLVHDYRRINRDIVWSTVHNDLPRLVSVLEPLVPPEEPA
jgi:uncharacterized protein with HEPN domain